MSIAPKYRKSLTEQWSLRFKTNHPDGDNYDGVVIQIKPDFIVLREGRDFELDGIIVLPKRVIKGYRDGKYEQCWNRILRQTGTLKKLRVPRWLESCETLPQVLTALRRRDIWPIVETVYDQGANSAFYLGPVTQVGEKSFFLKCYDAAGKWEKEYELSYDEVFRIEFDSQYCNHFNSYMRATER